MTRCPWSDVLVLWGAGLCVLLGSDLLAGVGGLVAENAGALPAAFFLLAPVAWLRRRDQDPAEAGIHGRQPLVALGWAGVVALAVFPPYVAGYEVWSRWTSGQPFRLPDRPLAYFEAAVRGRPASWSEEPALHVFVEAEWLHVLSTASGSTPIVVERCGCPRATLIAQPDGGLLWRDQGRACTPGEPIREAVGQGRGVACATATADRIVLRSNRDIPWRLGSTASHRPSGPLVLDRSPWWLIEILLVHLVMVALPEEVFYRGFVQTRLAQVFSRRWRFFGTLVGPEVIVASALFALSHLVTIPHPYRLAVFFPGLLFGWLRARTGGILAPAFLHAASNVLLEFLVRCH